MPLNAQYGGMTPDLPFVMSGYGLRTPFGILLPPGGQVAAFVRSTGPQSGDDPYLAANLVTTLAAGLARARSGLGDTVVVLPGHTENVADGTTFSGALVKGTRIIGFGQGSNMPKFTWTTTGSQCLFNQPDVIVSGLRLSFTGANGITCAIDVTAADCVFYGNDIEVANGATAKAAIALRLSAGADRCQIANNIWRGTATHNVTNGLLVNAAVDQVRIVGNEMEFSATAANGNVNIAGAATHIKVFGNYMHNTMTSSTACLAVADVASTGTIADNYANVENNGVAANQGVVFAGVTTTKIRCFQDFCSDEPGKSGGLAPGVVAT